MTEKKRKTPLLDELEKGPWPSFVKEIKKEADKNPWSRTRWPCSSARTRSTSATGSTVVWWA